MSTRTIQRIQEELPELPFIGPFGGIQSELPMNLIEQFGFSECLNVILRKASASIRPGNSAVDNLVSPPVGFADFYDKDSNRHSVAFLRDALYELAYPNWNLIGGVLSGTDSDLMAWSVVNNKLLFSQGIDVVKSWDGVAGAFADVSPDAVPAKFLLELATHLLALNTFEGGTFKTQRVRYTAAGDPTDWTGFNAGAVDILNDLGPINGAAKVQENGYAFHPNGLTRIIPTGIGLRPFDFVPFNDKTRGCFFPRSIASFGDQGAAYVARNDVFLLTPSSFQSLGAQPIDDGRKQVGARSRIVAELLNADPTQVYGFASQAIGGEYFQAYWLVIPGGSVWVYNLDEQNWTRFRYPKQPKVIGRLQTGHGIRWMDLIGSWADQTVEWKDFSSTTFFDTLAVGFTDGSVGIPEFASKCESAYTIASGSLSMGDRRHTKTLERFRIGYQDGEDCTFQVVFTNEKGQQDVQNAQIVGGGTGKDMVIIVTTKLNGLYLQWQVVGGPDAKQSFTEFTPIYVVGGEYKR